MCIYFTNNDNVSIENILEKLGLHVQGIYNKQMIYSINKTTRFSLSDNNEIFISRSNGDFILEDMEHISLHNGPCDDTGYRYHYVGKRKMNNYMNNDRSFKYTIYINQNYNENDI